MAAVYHFKFCRAILVGFRNQLRKDGVCKDGFVGMLESGMEGKEVPAVLPCFLLTNDKGSILKVQIEIDKVFRDDLTGQLLDPELLRLRGRRNWNTSTARTYGCYDPMTSAGG